MTNAATIKYILSDIEGTTTSISFVHEVLFPYSYERLQSFVKTHEKNGDVIQCLAETIATVAAEDGKEISSDEAAQTLLRWIKEDRKHSALKKLQGMLWAEGYETKAYTSDVYPDVVPNLKKWTADGTKVGIYSSGSVQAQKLLFGHTPFGDINPLISHYFDTAVGAKKEASSYKKIVNTLELVPNSVVFLSDIEGELVAAEAAGLRAIQLVRPGTKPSEKFVLARDFNEVDRKIATWNNP